MELHVDEYGVVLMQNQPKSAKRPDPAWEFLGKLQGAASTDVPKKKPMPKPIDSTPCLIYRARKRAHFETTGLFMTPPERVELRWSGSNGGILGTIAVRNRQFTGPELTCPDSPIQQRVRTFIDHSDDSRLVVMARSERMFVGGLLLGSLVFIVLGLIFGQLFWMLDEVTGVVIAFRFVSGLLIAFGLWGAAFCSYRLWYFSRTLVFDHAIRQLTVKERSVPRKERWSRELKLMTGVEVVRGGYLRELGSMGSEGKDIDGISTGTTASSTTYTFYWELNLILNSGERVKLLYESRAGLVVAIGERIASFLNVSFKVSPPEFEKHDGVVMEGELQQYQNAGRG